MIWEMGQTPLDRLLRFLERLWKNMGTKNNPGKFDCYKAAEPDEPIFILRARDPMAPILVRLWAALRAEQGCLEHQNHTDEHNREKVSDAMQIADDMFHWRKNK